MRDYDAAAERGQTSYTDQCIAHEDRIAATMRHADVSEAEARAFHGQRVTSCSDCGRIGGGSLCYDCTQARHALTDAERRMQARDDADAFDAWEAREEARYHYE